MADGAELMKKRQEGSISKGSGQYRRKGGKECGKGGRKRSF